MQPVLGILANVFTGVLILLSLILIVVVVLQTPKSEGFGGGVQNTPGGTFRGKAGYDEMLSNYTRVVAIAWLACAALLGVFHNFAG